MQRMTNEVDFLYFLPTILYIEKSRARWLMCRNPCVEITKNPLSSKELIMCDPKKQCDKPENLKTTPEECTPEQIRECHGVVEDHPCMEEQGNE